MTDIDMSSLQQAVDAACAEIDRLRKINRKMLEALKQANLAICLFYDSSEDDSNTTMREVGKTLQQIQAAITMTHKISHKISHKIPPHGTSRNEKIMKVKRG